jgi:hypothetical protein
VSLVIFYFTVPETKGLAIEDVEDLFRTDKERMARKQLSPANGHAVDGWAVAGEIFINVSKCSATKSDFALEMMDSHAMKF